VGCLAPSSRRRKRKCARHVKVTRAPWKKEIGACAWTRSENVKDLSGTRGVAGAEEAVGGAEAVGEEGLMMIVAGVLETVAGAAGADAPGPCHDPGPDHLEDVVLLLANPLSVQGVLGPALLVQPEDTAPRDGTRGHTRDPALPHPVGGSVLSPPHRLANASPPPVARGAIAVVHLPAEGDIHQITDLGHVVGALATGRVGVAGAPPLHDAERRVSLDLLPRGVGGVKEAIAIAAAAAAAALAVDPPVIETAWMSIVVA